MRGYCPKCKEYRSDDGFDAWGIIWRNGRPTCERCGSYVDVWRNNFKNCNERHAENSFVSLFKEDKSRRESEKRKREKQRE